MVTGLPGNSGSTSFLPPPPSQSSLPTPSVLPSWDFSFTALEDGDREINICPRALITFGMRCHKFSPLTTHLRDIPGRHSPSTEQIRNPNSRRS